MCLTVRDTESKDRHMTLFALSDEPLGTGWVEENTAVCLHYPLCECGLISILFLTQAYYVITCVSEPLLNYLQCWELILPSKAWFPAVSNKFLTSGGNVVYKWQLKCLKLCIKGHLHDSVILKTETAFLCVLEKFHAQTTIFSKIPVHTDIKCSVCSGRSRQSSSHQLIHIYLYGYNAYHSIHIRSFSIISSFHIAQ